MKHYKSAQGAALVVLLATAAWLWAHEGHAPLPTKGVAIDIDQGQVVLSPEAREGLGVETADARLVAIEETLSMPTVVVSPWQKHAHASARVGGKIAAIHVQLGQTVEAGTVLAEVHSPELDAMQVELRTAQAEAALAAANLKQLETAGGEGVVSGQVVQDARSRYRENANALEIARRKLLALEISDAAVETLLRDPAASIRALAIKAPIGGVISHADTRVGQVIEPSDHLFGVTDLSVVWLRFDVLERDLPRLASGQDVTVRWEGGGVTRTTLQMVSVALEPLTHLGIAWAEVPNSAEQRLLPGMVGQTEVTVRKAHVIAVPETALVRQGSHRYVFMREGPGQYVKQNVVPGQRQDGLIEIKRGALVPGDQVLTAGSHELSSFFTHAAAEPATEKPRTEAPGFTGQIELPPDRRAVATTRLAGSVRRILVDRNQAVQAGEIIAEVVSLEFQSLQLDLLRNQLQLELLEETLKQLKPLAAQNNAALSRRAVRETESAALAARQRRDGLRRKLEAVGLSTEQVSELLEKRRFVAALPVRAPIAGVVAGTQATLGQAVKADDALFEIHDLSKPPLVRGFVAARQLPEARVGQTLRVRVPSSSEPFDAVIVRAGARFDGPDRTLSIWAEPRLAGQSPLLRHGMMARLITEKTNHRDTEGIEKNNTEKGK